jgi:hypothetical protein
MIKIKTKEDKEAKDKEFVNPSRCFTNFLWTFYSKFMAPRVQ